MISVKLDKQTERRIDIPSLTGMRGMAALWVLIGHVWDHAPQFYPWTHWFDFIVHTNNYAVDLFFILSGFIMMHVYGHTAFLQKRHWYAQFISARFARIYPAYFVALIIMITPACIGLLFGKSFARINLNLQQVIANVLMVQNWGWSIKSYMQPSWSISAEWFAYVAVFPVAVWLYMRQSKWWHYLLSGVMALAGLEFFRLWFGVEVVVRWDALVRVAFEFLLGASCYGLRGVLTDRLEKCSRWNDWVLVGIGVCLFLRVNHIIKHDFLLLAFMAWWLLGLSFARCRVGRIFSTPKWIWLGEISYSLYVIHDVVLYYFYQCYAMDRAAADGAIFFVFDGLIYMLGSISAATLLYYLVEKPGRSSIRAVFDKKLDNV